MRSKFVALTTLFLSALSIPCAYADNQDACGSVMCLAGNGGSACTGYLADYFDIVVLTHGDFNPSATSNARQSYLNECTSAPASMEDSENADYGKQNSETSAGAALVKQILGASS